MSAPTLRVAVPCTGLGRQRRGFETFTRDLHHALRGVPGLELAVFGGGGDLEPSERAVWNLPRASSAARAVASLTRWDPYFVEQATFFAGFLPRLLAWRPHLIYFADLNLGNACWHWRRVSSQSFGLLFYNGGATTRPYTRCDWVQQLTPEHYDAAVARGESAERMLVLPHGVHITSRRAARNEERVAATRRAFGTPDGTPMLLSVGMRDRTIKRMHALVDAVAALGAERPHLVLLGAETDESASLATQAKEQLGARVWMGTWPRERMTEAYEAADAFALLSRREGFGLAYVEALAAGLPCVAHDTPGTRHLFGDLAYLGDTDQASVTAALIRDALREAHDEMRRDARHRRAYEHFSWDRLAPRYAELLRSCSAGRRPDWSGA